MINSMTLSSPFHIRRSSAPLCRICQIYRLVILLLFVPAGAHGFDIVDSDGIIHQFSEPAKRIISLYPAHTENLVELGAETSLLGIAKSDTYPDSILAKPRFSHHDSLEKIIAAAPDCILVRPMILRSKPNLIKKLRAYGIPVISLQPTSFAELYPYWRSLGKISGNVSKAEQMIHSFQKELSDIQKTHEHVPISEKPRVYFESIHARMRTFSPDSISMFCVYAAGGINIAEDAVSRNGTNIADYSKERILAKAHDIDVFLAQSGRMNRITYDEIINEPGFGAIKAIREKAVYLVDEHLVSRPTTRLLEGIREIRQLIYPQSSA